MVAPIALSGIIEGASQTGISGSLTDAAQSLMFPQLHTLGIYQAQTGFYRHPVQLPTPDALMSARVRGFFGDVTGKKPDPFLETMYIWMMRRNGVAVGDRGYSTIEGVRWDQYQLAWKKIHESMFRKPGISEAFAGLISGVLTQDEFEKLLMRNGALKEDWQWLLPFMSNRLTVNELIPLYNRGLLTDPQLDTYLKVLQYGIQSDRDAIRSMAKEIPGYQDIVRFAIREAFNPDMVRELQLDLELDENPDYLEWANASGLGEVSIKSKDGSKKTIDFAKMFWYAHWDLPSPGQAYQFMHRFYAESRYGASPWLKHASPFSAADLNALLKANDYSPRFRGHLAGISYNPFTRVDVRRVRAKGLINKEDVYHNYRAGGYDDFQANALTEFTELEVADAKFKKRRNDILKRACTAFTTGIIDEPRMKEIMREVDFKADEIEHHVHTCKIDIALTISKETVVNVRTGFMQGSLTRDEAIRQLELGGVKSERITQYLFRWEQRLELVKRAVNTKEIAGWYIEDIISRMEFVSRLTKLNYSQQDLTRIVQAADLVKAKAESKLQERAKGEMEKLIAKNLKEAEKMRKEAELREREANRTIAKAIERERKAIEKRLQQFLQARSTTNLKQWYTAGELTADEVRDTLRLKGWIEADIERWLRTNTPEE
jgi:hypothetical protein